MKDGRAGKPKNPSGGPGWHARKPDKEFYPLHPVSNLLLLPERYFLSPERALIYKAGL